MEHERALASQLVQVPLEVTFVITESSPLEPPPPPPIEGLGRTLHEGADDGTLGQR